MSESLIQTKTNRKRKLVSTSEKTLKVDVTDDDLSTLADDEKVIESLENSKQSNNVHPVSFLFRMNEDRFRILVSNWLDIQSIAKLDTALTNHTLRPYWINCLGSMSTLSCWKSIPENKVEEAVIWITEKNNKFSNINLSESPFITNKSIIRIARKCAFLDGLDVKYFNDMTDATLASLSFGCPLLRTLHIQGSAVTDLGLHCVAEGFRGLHEFYFNKCENITDEGLITLSRRCTKLQGIHLIGGKLFTDSGVCTLTKSCHILKSISIIKCLNINDATIVGISSSCPLLEELTFAGINNGITDLSLSSLAIGCTCLKMFSFLSTDISATGDISSHITDVGITNLVKGCTNLQLLSIYFCQNVSDYGLSMIAQHSKLLTSFILEDNIAVTATGISNIVQSCRNISVVKVANCSKIAVDDMQVLKRNHPILNLSYNDTEVNVEASVSPCNSSNSHTSGNTNNNNNGVVLQQFF